MVVPGLLDGLDAIVARVRALVGPSGARLPDAVAEAVPEPVS
jgi:hypothetical protein